MGFAEYGVRNSEMSVTSGPFSDSESREALRNAFAQPPQCIDSHLPTGIPLEREIEMRVGASEVTVSIVARSADNGILSVLV